jgi:phage terminase large subunit GpA-like protein
MILLRDDYWKDELYSRLQRQPPAPGSWRLPVDAHEDSSGGWQLLRQITAEHRVPLRTGKKGHTRRDKLVWTMRPGRSDNHYLDCAKIVTALANHVGVPMINPQNVRPEQSAPASPRPAGARSAGLRPGAMTAPRRAPA